MSWRLAVRSLLRTPVVSTMAVLSLALGVGASTALFSILESLLLRSLPVRDPARLVLLENGRGNTSWTNLQWEQLRDRPALFAGALAWSEARFNTAKSGQAEWADGLYASGSFFDVLGVPAVLGRTITPSDDRRGGGHEGPVAMISYGFWQRRYGGAADVLGRVVTLERVPFTIVGVTPPGFLGLDVGRSFDVAVPIGTEPLMRGRDSALDHRSYWWLSIMARLAPGQTAEQARSALRGVQRQIREATIPGDWPAEFLKSYLSDPFGLERAATGDSSLRNRYRRPLATLMVAVGLLLLIACANIANLLLARATSRRHELAVRAALGASRLALARALVTESLLLSAAGALLGLAFSRWAGRLLVAQLSTTTNHVVLDLSVNPMVLAFTTGIAMATALVFGTAPAWRASRARPQEALIDQGRGTAGTGRLSASGTLVVAQVALSLVLVVAAGLFGRTFASLASLDLGFDRERVLVSGVNARRSAVDPAAQPALFERLRQAALAVPGVADAAVSVVTPVSGSTWMYGVEVLGEPPRSPKDRSVHVNIVSPDWFRTYATGVTAGRDISERDGAGSARVALVNQAFVRKFLDGKPALGRLVQQTSLQRPAPPAAIVGVVEDAVYRSLRDPVPPTMYLALAQHDRPLSQASLSIRSAGPPVSTLIRPLAAAMGAIDADLAFTFRPLADQVDGALVQERLIAILSGFFGVLAVLLAALGLYGVTAYSVARRRAEIGIRMALGGAPGSVVRLVLRRVIVLVAAGVVLGGVGAFWAARFVGTLVFGIEARDPATFAAAACVLLAVGVLAGWVPARRAASIDPVAVLRDA